MRASTPGPARWSALVMLMTLPSIHGMVCAAEPDFFLGPCVVAADDSGFDNLDIIDARLDGKLAILRVGSEMGDNKLLSVFAGLKNKTSRKLTVEIETIYKDKDGNALNDGSWIPMTLEPHAEKEYRSASISLDAVDFLVRIRRAAAPSSSESPAVSP